MTSFPPREYTQFMAIILFLTLIHLIHLHAYAWNLVVHKNTTALIVHELRNELKISMRAYSQTLVTSAANLCFTLLTIPHLNVYKYLSLIQHHSSVQSVLSMDALYQPSALVHSGAVPNSTATPTKPNFNVTVLWTITKSTLNFYFQLAMSPLPVTHPAPCLLFTSSESLWYSPPLTRGLAMSHDEWQGSWVTIFMHCMGYG